MQKKKIKFMADAKRRKEGMKNDPGKGKVWGDKFYLHDLPNSPSLAYITGRNPYNKQIGNE